PLDRPISCTGQADGLEDLVDAARRMIGDEREDPEVVAGAAPGVERRVFEHRADAGARPIELLVGDATERGGTRRRADQAEQRTDRGALAGSVRPEEPGHATGLDAKREVLDGGDAAELL